MNRRLLFAMIVSSLSIIPVFASKALVIRLADSTEIVCKLEKEPQMVFANKKITLSSTEGTIGQWDFNDVVLWKFDEVKEVDAIEQILKSHKLKVESYTGKRGTEESFLNMSGQAPQILHVATHGFFYTPDEAQKIDYLRGYEDAMSLSGLIMSGGNAAWSGKELPEGVLGGILTASNIARLDLSNTNLTVLSACQSGKGQATPEGLYGLQRAFKKAGVKTMIMSLWNVSDVVSAEFMKIFYENLFDEDIHQDIRRAFDQAKMAIRKKYPNPYYWACFMMMD